MLHVHWPIIATIVQTVQTPRDLLSQQGHEGAVS
jgi:hypothetical protein